MPKYTILNQLSNSSSHGRKFDVYQCIAGTTISALRLNMRHLIVDYGGKGEKWTVKSISHGHDLVIGSHIKEHDHFLNYIHEVNSPDKVEHIKKSYAKAMNEYHAV